VWFNAGMGAALVFTRGGGEERFELSGRGVTIGRGADCELPVADDRISTRHCRVWANGGDWMIEDLKSTNRTFVNGEPVADQPRRLRHGDVVRLGARDARLFEARLVIHERSAEHRAAAREVAEGVQREVAELKAQLAARNDEVTRLGAMIKRLQAQLLESDTASAAARRTGTQLTVELDDLRSMLATERTDHAATRDELDTAQRRCTELEAELEAHGRKARRDRDDAERGMKDLESQLRMTSSELTTTRAALASATDNVRSLQQAHDDAVVQLRSLGDLSEPAR
jgi:hypothetical protein